MEVFVVSVLEIENNRGIISGDRRDCSKKKLWDHSGYYKNGHIMMAFRSSSEEGIGFGTLMLQRNETGTAPYYSGVITSVRCRESEFPQFRRCRAIMIPGEAELLLKDIWASREQLEDVLTPKQIDSLFLEACRIEPLIEGFKNKSQDMDVELTTSAVSKTKCRTQTDTLPEITTLQDSE